MSNAAFNILFGLILATGPAFCAESLSDRDRTLVSEAFRLGKSVHSLWPNWEKSPFALLLVGNDSEFLFCHPRPSADFDAYQYDQELGGQVYRRPRQFPNKLLATFPAVGGVPTIVIGRPETTGLDASAWVLTAVHEHFHQLQMSDPQYYAEVNALDLANGDTTGNWMLNYPFPYESTPVTAALAALARQARDASFEAGKKIPSARLRGYLAARRQLEQMLSEEDYRYFSFQLWQEGIARYTQLAAADWAAEHYRPGQAFRQLKDYAEFSRVASELRHSILADLSRSPADSRRVFFYALGAAEGLLLDAAEPDWKNRYLTEKFYLDRYFTGQR